MAKLTAAEVLGIRPGLIKVWPVHRGEYGRILLISDAEKTYWRGYKREGGNFSSERLQDVVDYINGEYTGDH